MTSVTASSCRCDPPWPGLVAHTEAGDVDVEPAATPGALACLYQAYCTHCRAIYPGPFRVPPAIRRAGYPTLRKDAPVTVSPGEPFDRILDFMAGQSATAITLVNDPGSGCWLDVAVSRLPVMRL